MSIRLRTASLVVALGCACAEESDDQNAETGTVTATAGTTMTATATMTTSSASDAESTGASDASESTDPTADPTTDPTAEVTTDPTVDPDTGSSDDGAESSSGGPSGFNVSGNASRAAAGMISNGDDGIGTLFIGALVACDQNAASAGGATVLGADMSQVGSPVGYIVEGLPSGTYYLAAFLDDDVNADPENPTADMGDIAFAEGFGIGCVEVVVAEADAVAGDIQLNINVPF